MNGRAARKLRQMLGLKLPVKSDLRVAKEVLKKKRVRDKSGNEEVMKVSMRVLVNANKYQYRKVKKAITRGAARV